MKEYRELIAMRAKLDKEIEAARTHARHEALAKIKLLIAEFRITERELRGLVKEKERTKPAPRYWNPHTGATWSGRGRRPRWLEEETMATFLLPTSDEHPAANDAPEPSDDGQQGCDPRRD
ncbi:H-NS family nucleoid-associated regulatory protein [Burkholderia ubonensis]|uniref:H-NS histone family protein n=1 Tax=Burkholderia ubonensis TaxID=101571 RepID=UPI0012FC7F55|nr:H-NS histone family protein [Burkholderia ubonensis]